MRIVASEFISLDGIVQAPGGAEEDTTGGFRHGGWSYQFFDPEVMGPVMGDIVANSVALLQGRTTYQVSAAAWPERAGQPGADFFNDSQKYVVSDTLTEADITWNPTTIIRVADLVEKVGELRATPGGNIYVYGSLTLVRALIDAQLLDELVLFIEPITLGGGKTLFHTDGEARTWELLSSQTASTGVIVCRYRPKA